MLMISRLHYWGFSESISKSLINWYVRGYVIFIKKHTWLRDFWEAWWKFWATSLCGVSRKWQLRWAILESKVYCRLRPSLSRCHVWNIPKLGLKLKLSFNPKPHKRSTKQTKPLHVVLWPKRAQKYETQYPTERHTLGISTNISAV